MATLTWIGTISSDWTVAGNWAPADAPANGDTAVINSGPTVQLLDLSLVGNTIDLGGLASLAFINDGSAISNLDSTTAIDVTGIATTIDVTGSLTDAGNMVIAGGASLDLAVGPNGPIPGNFRSNGTTSIGGGANLLITTSGSLDTVTTGSVRINGGTVVVDARLGAGGFFNIGSNSSLEVNQLLTSGGFGGGIDAAFDGTNATLKLDNPANVSFSFIPGFQTTDTIDIGQTTIGTVTYSGTQLSLFDNSGTEFFNASLIPEFGQAIQSGTFVVPGTGGIAGNLLVTQGVGQDTELSILPPATLSWKNSGAGALSDPSNWTLVGGFGSTTPASGDTLLISMGTVVGTDDPFMSNLVSISNASLVLTNDTGSFDAANLDFITVLNADVATLESQGLVVNHGTIDANGNLVIDAEQFSNGTTTLPGLFDNHGTMTVAAGAMLSVSGGANAGFANTQVINDVGGTVRLGSGVLGVHGAWLVSQKGAIEVAGALPSGPTFDFADSSGNLLKLDAVGSFQGLIDGFQAGNAIDVGPVNVGSVGYDSSTGLLTLINAGTTVGSLLLGSGVFASASDFNIGTVGGDTVLTTTQTNDVWTGGTAGMWSASINWGDGVPTANDTAAFGPGTAGATITASETVGSLLMQAPFAEVDVDAPLTVVRPIQEVWGNILTNSGGTVTAPSVQQASASSDITFDVLGGTAVLTGSKNALNPAGGPVALVDNVNVSVVGSTLDAGGKTIPGTTGGYISIGQAAGGDVNFSSGMNVQTSFDLSNTPSTVYATYTMLGSDPTSFGQLYVSGTGTNWTDVGDATDPNTRGYILVGVNSSSNLATPLGGAQLQLSDGAVMTETTFAELGVNANSIGTVEVTNSAEWVVGTGNSSFLDVGELGNGALLVSSGGTVAIAGGGGTIVSNGTSSVARGGLGVGVGIGSTGTVIVGDTGFIFGTTVSTLSTNGKVGVGLQGQGELMVATNGSFTVSGNNLGVGGFGSGAMGGSGTVAATSGGEITVGHNLFVWQGSTISVDGTSGIVLGTGDVVAGDILIGVTNAVLGDGLIDASMLDQGAIVSTNAGNVAASNGGTLEITGPIDGTGGLTLAAGSTLRLDALVTGSNAVLFNSGSAETLILDTPGSAFGNAISGLAARDRIEFGNGMTITAAAVISPGTVEVDFVGGTYDLTSVSFAGGSPQTFITGHDTASGDDFIQVTCFAAGTRIGTPRGEVAVEELREDDLVLLADGEALPVVWLGHRFIDCARHPRPELVWPVRIAAGAFGAGRPARDLFVSPDHAVLVGDVLVPAKYLIDGEAIVQVRVPRVTYWHVELARHAVLLAEGLAVESYLDTGDRANFANGGARVTLWPDFASRAWEARGCAPLVVSGPMLDAAHAAIRGRGPRRAAG
jgi:T5SS/PEP-CTERM-associated repeat protein